MWIIVVVLVLLAVVGVWGLSRLRRLTTEVGVFDCAYRAFNPSRTSTDDWTQGLCKYQSDRLEWWRVYSLTWKPNRGWLRDHFDLTGRVPLDLANMPGLYLVQCRYQGVPFELMMSAEAYHGLSSWIESAPPTPRGYDY